ncbi:MAG: hypothetical protein ACK58L_13050 [Planctomycetota bacterium]
MKRALLTLALACFAFSCAVTEAGNESKGGFTISSHRSGGRYPFRNVRFMTGRGPGSVKFIAGAGYVDKKGNAVIEGYIWNRVGYTGLWGGGPRSTTIPDRTRLYENFVFAYANDSQYCIVDEIDFY